MCLPDTVLLEGASRSSLQHRQEREVPARAGENQGHRVAPQGVPAVLIGEPAPQGAEGPGPVQLELVHHGKQIVPLAGALPRLGRDLQLPQDASQLFVPLLVLLEKREGKAVKGVGRPRRLPVRPATVTQLGGPT